MQLALGDALAIALLESRGFTAVDFGLLHPGGRLGVLLKFTRDVMHSGKSIPLAPLGTKMSDAVLEMSAKGFGCVGITGRDGKLVGIITDGDLRRHMRPDSARRPRRRDHDAQPEDRPARSARQRDAGIAQLHEDHRVVRGRGGPAGRHRAYPRSVASRRRLELCRDRQTRRHRCACSTSSPRTGISCRTACRWRAPRVTRASRFMSRPVSSMAQPRSRPKASCCIRCRSCAAGFRRFGTIATDPRAAAHPPRGRAGHRPSRRAAGRRARLAGSVGTTRSRAVNALTGLGYTFTSGSAKALLLRPVMGALLRLAAEPPTDTSCWCRTPTTAPTCSRSASPPNASC